MITSKVTRALMLMALLGLELPGKGETICPKCGKAVSKEARSCEHCGENLKRESEATE